MLAVEVLEVVVANALAEGREEEGSITLIISPLSAIEKDQYTSVVALLGVKLVVLDSELNYK